MSAALQSVDRVLAGRLQRAAPKTPRFLAISALAHAALGHALAAQGAHEEAIKSAEHALRLSPSDPRVGAQASHVLVFARFAAGPQGMTGRIAVGDEHIPTGRIGQWRRRIGVSQRPVRHAMDP